MSCAGPEETDVDDLEDWYPLDGIWDDQAGNAPWCQLIRAVNKRADDVFVTKYSNTLLGVGVYFPTDGKLAAIDWDPLLASLHPTRFAVDLLNKLAVKVNAIRSASFVDAGCKEWHWKTLPALVNTTISEFADEWDTHILEIRAALDVLTTLRFDGWGSGTLQARMYYTGYLGGYGYYLGPVLYVDHAINRSTQKHVQTGAEYYSGTPPNEVWHMYLNDDNAYPGPGAGGNPCAVVSDLPDGYDGYSNHLHVIPFFPYYLNAYAPSPYAYLSDLAGRAGIRLVSEGGYCVAEYESPGDINPNGDSTMPPQVYGWLESYSATFQFKVTFPATNFAPGQGVTVGWELEETLNTGITWEATAESESIYWDTPNVELSVERSVTVTATSTISDGLAPWEVGGADAAGNPIIVGWPPPALAQFRIKLVGVSINVCYDDCGTVRIDS